MADWTTDVTVKIAPGMAKELRHHPAVVAQLAQLAAKIAATAEAGHTPGSYGVIVQNKPSTRRARALVHPTSGGGIHLELTQHLMLKAAIGQGHKTISTKPSNQALAMGTKQGDSTGVVVAGVIHPTGDTTT
jgi:hypothetical protein